MIQPLFVHAIYIVLILLWKIITRFRFILAVFPSSNLVVKVFILGASVGVGDHLRLVRVPVVLFADGHVASFLFELVDLVFDELVGVQGLMAGSYLDFVGGGARPGAVGFLIMVGVFSVLKPLYDVKIGI